jgi:A/G-specific adenine glycosylase
MDFGATVCKPLPKCEICFFNSYCKAFLKGKQLVLPVKSKEKAVKKRWFNYLVLEHKGSYAVKQRKEKDIWQNLFEFPLIETNSKAFAADLLMQAETLFGLGKRKYRGEINSIQRLTHQLIHFQFCFIELHSRHVLEDFSWVSKKDIATLPFPKTLQQYIGHHLQ